MMTNKNPEETTREHPFSTDRPIESREQDLLGRRGFADSVAASVRNWTGKDSLVMAVYGQWGMGKTSVKNMILDSLREDNKSSPVVLEFNPWQWAGQEQIAKAFFDEIGLALGRTDKSKEGKKRATKWKAYGARLKMVWFLASGSQRGLYFVAGFFFVVGLIGTLGCSILITIISWVLFLLGILGGLLGFSHRFAEYLSSVFESSAMSAEKNLDDFKKDLRETLATLHVPLLIVIDDVDRLSKEETKLLFQLVKANADFPNIIYFLLFQRDIVEDILREIVPTTGRDYLEKIVQVGFDIPVIERVRLEKVLFARLDQVLEGHGIGHRFDTHRWGNIFLGGLRNFFENLRDVSRYISSLDFHVALFKNSKTFEVNPVDLIALEVLCVFEPDVYRMLINVKDELTGVAKDYNSEKDTDERIDKQVKDLVNRASESKQIYVREILTQLFPRIKKISYGEGFSERWYRELCVCHPDIFDRYFHYAIPYGDISQSELDTVLELAGDREGLVAKFRDLNARSLLVVTLDRLEAYKEEIDIIHAIPFVTALFDIGDELPDEPVGMSVFGAETHAWRIIYWYLMKEADQQKRENILMESISLTTGLYLPVNTISLEDDRRERQKEPDTFLVRGEALQSFIDRCVSKIKSASESGLLEDHRKMLYIFYTWRKWTSPHEPGVWVTELVESDSGVVKFLTALLQKSTSQGMGDYTVKVRWRIRLENVENFVPLTLVEGKIQSLDLHNLNEKEHQAVQAFKKALQRKEKGISDDDWRHDDDD